MNIYNEKDIKQAVNSYKCQSCIHSQIPEPKTHSLKLKSPDELFYYCKHFRRIRPNQTQCLKYKENKPFDNLTKYLAKYPRPKYGEIIPTGTIQLAFNLDIPNTVIYDNFSKKFFRVNY